MSSRPSEPSSIPSSLADAWRRDQARKEDIARAYVRFLGRRAPRPRPAVREIVLALVAGMFIGVGSLYAATGARLQFPWTEAVPISHPSPRSEHGRAAKVSRSTNIEAMPDPTARKAAVDPRESTDAEATSTRTPTRTGRVTEPEPASAPAAAARQGDARPASKTGVRTARELESWRRAARGLREGDFATADDALIKLSQQGSREERELADLVRAQILLSQGRVRDARALLEPLGRGAASATHREKARSLLSQIAPTPPSTRSFDLDPDTNQP